MSTETIAGGFCRACRKPFDEVHPLDFMNDFLCSEVTSDVEVAPKFSIGETRPISSYQGLAFRPCRMQHTWREHVQESYRRAGQVWFNPHIRVPEL